MPVRLAIGIVSDSDPESAERFGKKALGSGRVLPGEEKEVEDGAAGIHRPVEITPLAFYPDVGLVHTPAVVGGLQGGGVSTVAIRARTALDPSPHCN